MLISLKFNHSMKLLSKAWRYALEETVRT